MTRLHTVVYVSHADGEVSDAELERILDISRRNNSRDGITGALLHRDGSFMQCLEGEESAVRAAYERIARDARHAGVLVLMDEPIAERAFPSWSMAHLQPTESEMLALTTADWSSSTAVNSGSTASGFVALRSFAERYRR